MDTKQQFHHCPLLPNPCPSPSAQKPEPHLLLRTLGPPHPLHTSDLLSQWMDAFPFSSLHLQPLPPLCRSLCQPDQEPSWQ